MNFDWEGAFLFLAIYRSFGIKSFRITSLKLFNITHKNSFKWNPKNISALCKIPSNVTKLIY